MSFGMGAAVPEDPAAGWAAVVSGVRTEPAGGMRRGGRRRRGHGPAGSVHAPLGRADTMPAHTTSRTLRTAVDAHAGRAHCIAPDRPRGPGPAIRVVARGALRMPPGRVLACGMCACDGNGGAGSAGTCGAILHIPIRPRRLIRRRRREHHARFGLTIPIMPPSKRLTQRQEAPMFPLPPPAPRRRAGARRTDRKTVPDSYGLPPPSLPAGDVACCRMQSTPVS